MGLESFQTGEASSRKNEQSNIDDTEKEFLIDDSVEMYKMYRLTNTDRKILEEI